MKLASRALTAVALLAIGFIVVPQPAAATFEDGSPVGHLDGAAVLGDWPDGPADRTIIHIWGWSIDPDSNSHITSIAVFLDGVLVAYLPAANVAREDVAQAYPGFGKQHGFDFNVTWEPGHHRVCVAALNVPGTAGGDTMLGCSDKAADAFAWPETTEIASFDVDENGVGHIIGWALDPKSYDSVPVAAFLDGQLVGYTIANQDRPDIAATFPGYGPAHGFDLRVLIPEGPRRLACIAAINPPGSDATDRISGCTWVQSSPTAFGEIGGFTRTHNGLQVGGWAAIASLNGSERPAAVAVFDNNELAAYTTDLSTLNWNPCAPYQCWGFHLEWATATTDHHVCAYAYNGQGRGALVDCVDIL